MGQRIVLVGLLLLVAGFGLFKWERNSGASLAQARTVAVNVFILCEAAYLFNSRSFTRSPFTLGLFSNPWVIRGVAFMLAMQMLLTYAPFMNTLFSTAPIGLREWGLILASALLVFSLVEMEKRLRRKAAA